MLKPHHLVESHKAAARCVLSSGSRHPTHLNQFESARTPIRGIVEFRLDARSLSLTHSLQSDPTMTDTPHALTHDKQTALEDDLKGLHAAKDQWVGVNVPTRIQLLKEIKDCLLSVADDWVNTANRAKQIESDAPVAGEEWFSGPCALMMACSGIIETLETLDHPEQNQRPLFRQTVTGQLAIKAFPRDIWHRLLLSGFRADIWMQPGVVADTLDRQIAVEYQGNNDHQKTKGKVAVVLGAGNIGSISPLDALHKLFNENQVVMLKLNPVNDYLEPHLSAAFAPLIDLGVLKICRGDISVGTFLVNHPSVDELHITGAAASHDAIVWGVGREAVDNKRANTPKNKRRITSELGAVSPTIVVPGPWNDADFRFQAEHLATMKLHNASYNCVSVQCLLVSDTWSGTNQILDAFENTVQSHAQRHAYYPGSDDRQARFEQHNAESRRIDRGTRAPALSVAEFKETDEPNWSMDNEVFAPALNIKRLETSDPETFLRDAIEWANENLYGTLGSNILIHPDTIRAIGRQKFERILAEFKYGMIAVNAWTGVGFLLPTLPWGGFPGASLEKVGSGIGTVHNTMMIENTERTVLEGPFRPFPRSLFSRDPSIMPRPPWFVTARKQNAVGRQLTHFYHRPSWLKLPRLLLDALAS